MAEEEADGALWSPLIEVPPGSEEVSDGGAVAEDCPGLLEASLMEFSLDIVERSEDGAAEVSI